MPKPARPSSSLTPEALRAYALVGARLQLQRILEIFPELRDMPHATPPRPTGAPEPATRTCPQCGRAFTARWTQQKTCQRKRCVAAYKKAYMHTYFAKRYAARRAATNGK